MGYMVIIWIKKVGKVIYSEMQIFDCDQVVCNWMKKWEIELVELGVLVKVLDLLLSDVIDQYICENFCMYGKIKVQVLCMIKGFLISQLCCLEIDSFVLVVFVKSVLGVFSMCGNYLLYFFFVFIVVKFVWGYLLSVQVMDDVWVVLCKFGLLVRLEEWMW